MQLEHLQNHVLRTNFFFFFSKDSSGQASKQIAASQRYVCGLGSYCNKNIFNMLQLNSHYRSERSHLL